MIICPDFTCQLGQIEKILDNVITVDEVGTWPGWIHAVIIMTIYWTAHLTVFGIIWLIWWYYLFGEQQMEDQKYKLLRIELN